MSAESKAQQLQLVIRYLYTHCCDCWDSDTFVVPRFGRRNGTSGRWFGSY